MGVGWLGRVGGGLLVGIFAAGCGAEMLCRSLFGSEGLARTLVIGVVSAPITIPMAVAK